MMSRAQLRTLANRLSVAAAAIMFVAQSHGALLVGSAKVDITPRAATPQDNRYLGGYAPWRSAVSLCNPKIDVLDSIHARVLVIQGDDGTRLVFVATDTVLATEEPYWDAWLGDYLPATFPSGTRAAIASIASIGAPLGVSAENVMMFATHNHQAPWVLDPTAKGAVSRIMSGVQAACRNMTPAKLMSLSSVERLGAFRRPDFGTYPGVPVDSKLNIVGLAKVSDGTPIACLVNFPCHNTAIGRGHLGRELKCSAEVIGIAMKRVEHLMGPGYVAMFINGFCGDVGPDINDRPAGEDLDDPDELEDGYEQVVEIGETFGDMVRGLLAAPAAYSLDGTVKSLVKSWVVNTKPGWGPTNAPIPSLPLNVRGARIGKVALVALNGEPFNEIGARLRGAGTLPMTLTAGYCNGYAGYMPTRLAFADRVGGAEVGVKTPYTGAIEWSVVTGCESVLAQLADTKRLGSKYVWPSTETTSANVFEAVGAVAGIDMTVDHISLYVDNPTGAGRMALYADANGNPGAMLGQTGDLPLVSGWNAGALQDQLGAPVAASLSAGQQYWLAFVFSAGGNKVHYTLTSDNGGQRWQGQQASYFPLPSSGSNLALQVGDPARCYSIYAGSANDSGQPQETDHPVLGGVIPEISQAFFTPRVFVGSGARAGVDMVVDRISLYVSNPSGSARLGLYANNNGAPGRLVAQTPDLQLVNGWNAGAIRPTTLVNGKQYWLAFNLSDAGNTLYYTHDQAAENGGYWWQSPNDNYLPLPDTAPSADSPQPLIAGSSAKSFAIYASKSDANVLGQKAVLETAQMVRPGFLVATKARSRVNLIVDRLSLYASDAVGNARLGLYEDNNGNPGRLVAETPDLALSNGWNTGTIQATAIVGGRHYWLAFNLGQSGNKLYYSPNTKSSGGGGVVALPCPYGLLPPSGPSGLPLRAGAYSMYAGSSDGEILGHRLIQDPRVQAEFGRTHAGSGLLRQGLLLAAGARPEINLSVNRLHVYVRNAQNDPTLAPDGIARLGLFADDNGKPGALLGQVARLNMSAGWNAGAILAPSSWLPVTLNLYSGQQYWFGLEFLNTGAHDSGNNLYYMVSSAQGGDFWNNFYSDPLNGTFPTFALFAGNGAYAIYADLGP